MNLGKVTLAKTGDSRMVDLRKRDGGFQPLHVNLNWSGTNRQRKRGFLSMGGSAQAPDLDLGCMFELLDGRKSVIQPLGGFFGNAHDAPWILLDKDDRTGAATDGENLTVYRPDQLRRLLIFTLIYEGATDFRSVGGILTIRDGEGNETVVQLDNPDANRTFCAVCTFTNTGDSLQITKEERYFRDHEEADHFFQFGFRWKAGSK